MELLLIVATITHKFETIDVKIESDTFEVN